MPSEEQSNTQNDNLHLDNAAEALYQQLGGVDFQKLKRLSSESDRLAQGLSEEQRQYDALRSLVAHLVCHVSRSLEDLHHPSDKQASQRNYQKLENIIVKFSGGKNFGEAILIKHKGAFGEKKKEDKVDYEIVYGDLVLDADVARLMAKRQGAETTALLTQLNKAFESLWSQGINNFLIKIPKAPKESKRLWMSLILAAKYDTALKNHSHISYKIGGKNFSIEPVVNEHNAPDLNLTLLAILNGVKNEQMQGLVQKVEQWMRRKETGKNAFHFASTYDALLALKNLPKRLTPPPIEINNLKWMMVNQEQKQVTENMAAVARLAMSRSGGSSAETARVLKSVYGDDYARIDSQQVLERLQLTSGLLNAIDEKPEEKNIQVEVLNNVEQRLGKVSDKVFEDLPMADHNFKGSSSGKGGLFGKIHSKIQNMVGFYKRRSATKKKVGDMVHRAIDFDTQDYETLAKDFHVSTRDAETLIKMLKSCFDEQGNFKKSTFSKLIPDLDYYERKIFEYLWRNLKESLHQSDRGAFLDSLQLLVDRLKRPKNAISVLLEDLSSNPSVIRFGDHTAFMLGNRLIRTYSKEIVSYQITPEDVLLVVNGLDERLTDYAAWKIDRKQDAFFEKVRTIHRRLLESLDDDEADKHVMGTQDLVFLEREVYIFFALVGGNTGRSLMMSALKEYGHPKSDIYQLKGSQKHMTDLLQLLKIVVRGIGRIGESDQTAVLDQVKAQLQVFLQMTESMHCEDLIHQIQEHIFNSTQSIEERS
jgi:hypothetical protein